MKNEDRMLRLVMSYHELQEKLYEKHDYKHNNECTVEDALRSDIPILATLAKIIRNMNGVGKKANEELYKEVFNYLKENYR